VDVRLRDLRATRLTLNNAWAEAVQQRPEIDAWQASAMSGGMVTGAGRPLVERVSVTRPRETTRESRQEPHLMLGARHCWVVDPPEATGRWPGLLLRWSRSASGQWQGQVAYAFLRGSDVVLVEVTLDVSLLRRR